jgi:ribosome-associated translation inhibitor RaiA
MKTRILFRDFDELPHQKNFVSYNVEHIIGKYDTDQDLEINVIIGRHWEAHKSGFECEILVHGHEIGRVVVAKDSSKDFYQAVRGALRVAEKIIRRKSDKNISLRRRTITTGHMAV